MSDTGFSTSSGIGGGDSGRDYNPTSTDLDQQPAGDSGNFGGGVGDRTQGGGAYSADSVQQPSSGDQYGSSGGYAPDSAGGGQGQGGQLSGGGVGPGGGMGSGGGQGGGDALDKGVDFAERKSGHEMSHSTTEKISDGVRTGFSKMTGKDVPIKDQNYN